MSPVLPSGRTFGIIAAVAVVLSLLLAVPPGAVAQERTWLVPRVGYEFGLPLNVDRLPGLVNRFAVAGTGTAENHTLVSGLGVAWDDPLGIGLGITGSLELALSLGSFTSDIYTSQILDTASGSLVTTENRFTLGSTLALARFEVGTSLRVGGHVRLGAGLLAAWRGSSGIVLRENIVSDDTASFADGSRSRIVAAGEDLGSLPWRFALRLSLGYRFPITSSLELVPSAFAALDLTSLSDQGVLKSLSGGVALALPFDVSSTTTGRSRDIPDPPVRPALSASVDLYSVAGDDSLPTLVVRQQRTLYRRSIPLLPRLLFDRDSTAIPVRYATLDRSAASAMTMDNVAGLDLRELHLQTLNVVGLRMRDDRSTRLSIVGSRNRQETAAAAVACATAVRDYLHDVWDVSLDRLIMLPPTLDSTTAVRPVELRSSDRALLGEPIEVEWTVRGYSVPTIALARMMVADAGLLRWDVVVTRAGVEIARSSSRDGGPLEGLSGKFRVDEGGDEAVMDPLVAHFRIEDVNGDTVSAYDTLPVVVRRLTSDDHIDAEVIDGMFGEFDPGRNAVRTRPRSVGEEFGSLVRPGAEVHLWVSSGTADRTSRSDMGLLAAEILGASSGRGALPGGLMLASPADWHDPFAAAPEASLFRGGIYYRITQTTDGRSP